ncbi:MAG TPA: HEAT repeat domain-containing protein [Verrucomicrobiae bacterium]
MKNHLYRFAACVAFAAVALSAAAQSTSAEKARQALAALKTGAPAEKALACKTLAVYGSAEAVPALAPLLADEQLASWARIALEVIPGAAADDALREALGKVNGKLLVGVINSIAVRRDAKAVTPLIAKLGDADPEVASAAAVALGHIGGDAAVRALEGALTKSAPPVRSAAAQGCILCAEDLLAKGKPAQAAALYDTVRKVDLPKQRVLEATRGAILARQADGLPLLLETLRSPDKAVFGIGLSTARELPGRAVTDALVAEVGKASSERQAPLLLAVADRADDSVLPALLTLARDGSKGLRLVAMDVLVRQGNLACVPVLLDTIAGGDAELAQAATTALAGLPGDDVDRQLAARLPQVAGSTRRVLLELAGKRNVAAAVPELVKASGDADPKIRATAIKALGQTAGVADLRTLTDLLSKAKGEEEIEAIEAALESACTRITDKAACAAHVLACLPTSAAPAKCALLRVLGAITTPDALTAVKSALASSEAAVSDTAVRVLADWPDSPALPALLEVYRTTKDDSHRFLALRGCVRLLELGEQAAPQAVKLYGELLAGTQRPDDRKVLLSGLAKVADPAALKLVEPFLGDAQVQAEAELAVLGIASGISGLAPTEAKAAASRIQAQTKSEVTRERAARVLAQLEQAGDFITAWQIAGPYAEGLSGKSLFDSAFAPEQTDGKATWKPASVATKAGRPGMVDLEAAFGGGNRVAYARTWVFSEKAQKARIQFGTDDGHKLWVNGKLITQANRGGAAVADEFKADVELRAGWNAVLLKVTQDSGPWEFCLRVRDAAGGKLDGLRVQPSPP